MMPSGIFFTTWQSSRLHNERIRVSAIGTKAQTTIFRYPKEKIAKSCILDVDTCPPYAKSESEEIDNEIITRISPDSGAIENREILFFSRRWRESLPLPINTPLELARISNALP
jgi:hypothetical protein